MHHIKSNPFIFLLQAHLLQKKKSKGKKEYLVITNILLMSKAPVSLSVPDFFRKKVPIFNHSLSSAVFSLLHLFLLQTMNVPRAKLIQVLDMKCYNHRTVSQRTLFLKDDKNKLKRCKVLYWSYYYKSCMIFGRRRLAGNTSQKVYNIDDKLLLSLPRHTTDGTLGRQKNVLI